MLTRQHAARNAAVFIKLLRRYNAFMRGNLKHRISRGIYDKGAGAHVLLTVILQHLGAGIGLVAYHGAPGALFKFADERLRKAVRVGG